jgi:hypothetical protein
MVYLTRLLADCLYLYIHHFMTRKGQSAQVTSPEATFQATFL